MAARLNIRKLGREAKYCYWWCVFVSTTLGCWRHYMFSLSVHLCVQCREVLWCNWHSRM